MQKSPELLLDCKEGVVGGKVPIVARNGVLKETRAPENTLSSIKGKDR
jgi:hypothetical protein